MGQNSHTSGTPESVQILDSQLRGSYGRAVYSHKTHEKAAEILLSRLSRVKALYIILSALSAVGFASEFFVSDGAGSLLGAIFSSAILALSLFTKDRDWAGLAQEHRQAASDIWLIRERYESLIADLASSLRSLDDIRDMRDNVMKDLHAIYSKSPSTNAQAYNKAKKALKVDDEMTFADGEIDHFLPNALRRRQG